MSFEPVVLMMGVFSLSLGVAMYFWVARGERDRYFSTTNLVSWLLIALFPVLLIFSFFPQSEFSGGVMGATASGAIGAFIFIWWYGTKSGLASYAKDNAEAELRASESRIASLRQQLEASEKRGRPQALVLDTTRVIRYRLRSYPRRSLGLITGNLSKVDFVDAWVNSENTNMQMASFFDRSVSGMIRYLGALRDPDTGGVLEDVIANSLAEKMGPNLWVLPGTVFVTGPGQLAGTHGVKRIFHVAAVQGQPGVGYRPIEDIGCCVERVLKAVDAENREELVVGSIVLPLLGAGQGRANLEPTAKALFGAAIEYLRVHDNSQVESVYFVAYTDVELATCEDVLDHWEGELLDKK